MVELSRTWYSGRLDPDYEAPALDLVQGRLAAAGLTDTFWSLTG